MNALAKDDGKLTVPATVAERLFKVNRPVDSNVLEKLSDASRHALFIIPYAHMKNILGMQLQGPGGVEAAANGLRIFAEKHPQHAAAIAPLLQSYELLQGSPQFHTLANLFEHQDAPDLFRFQQTPDMFEKSPRGATFAGDQHPIGDYERAFGPGTGGPHLVKGISRHENVRDLGVGHVGQNAFHLLAENEEYNTLKKIERLSSTDPERIILARYLLKRAGIEPAEAEQIIVKALRDDRAALDRGSPIDEFASTLEDRFAMAKLKSQGYDAARTKRLNEDWDHTDPKSPETLPYEFASFDPSKIEPVKWQSYDDYMKRLVRMGAASPFTGKALNKMELASNEMLLHWDHAQRMGLDMYLLKHDPAYAKMDDLSQGAVINKILFDYYHQSNMARWLRKMGAPFPHWRIGSVGRGLEQMSEDPRRMAKMLRLKDTLIREYFPDQNDNESTYPNLNMPQDELGHAIADPGGYALGTLGMPGEAARLLIQGGGHLDPRDVVSGAGGIAQEAAGTYIPGERMGAEALSGLGQAIGADEEGSPGNVLDKIGQFGGSDLFHSKAHPVANLGLNLVGGHMTNYPSWFTKMVDQERELNPNESEYSAVEAVKRSLRRRHR
jgi:hypothetical protein